MTRALLLAIALAACGGKKTAPPDAAAICAGTVKAKDAIVLRAGDPIARGKAQGLRELATRAPKDNVVALAELDRFMAASDAAAIMTAHAEERERRIREDLEIARLIVEAIQETELRQRTGDSPTTAQTQFPEDWPFDPQLRFPLLIGARGTAEDVGSKAAELTKPLADGSALGAVNERAKALATTLADLAAKVAALETATDVSALDDQIAEAIKIGNIAHGKLNETIGALNTTGASLAGLADEQNGRRFAEAVRLWTRLSASAARLADPWPDSVLPNRQRAFVIAGPRQAVVTCSTPKSFAPPPAILAAVEPITVARNALASALGHAGSPREVPLGSLADLASAFDAVHASQAPKPPQVR